MAKVIRKGQLYRNKTNDTSTEVKEITLLANSNGDYMSRETAKAITHLIQQAELRGFSNAVANLYANGYNDAATFLIDEQDTRSMTDIMTAQQGKEASGKAGESSTQHEHLDLLGWWP